MKKIESTMRKQINKHCKNMKYQINTFVKFSSKNIKTIKLLKKLNDRIFNLEKINVFYYLKLFFNMH